MALCLGFQLLSKCFDRLNLSQKKKKNDSTPVRHLIIRNMTEFLRDIEELFNIFCNDQKQRQKFEEINKLKMNKDDFAFYKD